MRAPKIHRLVKSAAVILLATAAYCAHARLEGQTPTQTEIMLLPPYCQAKAMQGTPGYPDSEPIRWEKIIGVDLWRSLHHYCAGVNSLNRAYGTEGHVRQRNLADALEQFDYQLRSPPAGHPLVPEMYVNRAIALRLMGRDTEAMRDYNKALESNPKLRKAYLDQADYFADKKQSAEALKIVTQGLRYLPGDKALQQRYIEVGGKLPYPEPLEQSAAEEEKSTPAASTTGNKETASQSVDAPKTGSTPPVDNPSPAPNKPKIGSPTNPWCRFCPPE